MSIGYNSKVALTINSESDIMVTKQKIEIYLHYQDSDFFTRCAKKEEKDLLNDNDWFLIDSLMEDIHLMKNNLISSERKKEVESRIKKYTEGDNEFARKHFLK